MVDNYLESQIIPGSPIPKDEHRRLQILLVVAIVVAGAFIIGYWWNVNHQASVVQNVNMQTDNILQRIASLKQTSSSVTSADISSAIDNLKKTKSTVTVSDIENTIRRMKMNEI